MFSIFFEKYGRPQNVAKKRQFQGNYLIFFFSRTLLNIKNESLLRQARHLPHNVEITVEYLRRGTIALSKAMSSNSFIEWKATGLANYEQWSVRMKIQISLLHTSCCLMNSNEFGSSAAR